jgi:uncharacterized OB-fold protein
MAAKPSFLERNPVSNQNILEGQGPESLYLDALREGRFEIQKCTSCKSHVFRPRVLCPNCGSARLEWTEVDGRGTVYSTTTVHRKKEKGGNYNVSLIDLSEGVRMMSRVEGIDPDAVQIGMPVTVRISKTDDGNTVVFVPA